MADVDVHDAAGAYALDSLDDVERRAFERHLSGCVACRDDVAAMRETMVRLAGGVAVDPPGSVRERVLTEIRATPQLLRGAAGPRRVDRDRARRRSPWLVAAAAACVLALGATGFGAAQWQRARDADARVQTIAAVVGDPSAELVTAPVTGGGTVVVVAADDGRAVLSTSRVAALDQDRVYQLWRLRSDDVRSLGLGPTGAGAGGSWVALLDGVRSGDVIAVSVEPRGGSRQPTTTPIATVPV